MAYNINNKVISKRNMIIIIGVLTLWVIITAQLFYRSTLQTEVDRTEDTLKAVSNNNAKSVEYVIQDYKAQLILTSMYFADLKIENEYFEEVFKDLVRIGGFHKVAIVLPPGSGSTNFESDGEFFTPSEYEFTQEMTLAQTFVSDVFVETGTHNQVISINVPVISEDGKLQAYLMGMVSTQKLSTRFNESFYDIGGYYHVVDENGRYVANSNSTNMIGMEKKFHDALYDLIYQDGYSAEAINNAFIDREEGISKYSSTSGQRRIVYYSPIDINGWMMYSVVDADQVDAVVDSALITTYWFMGSIGVVLLFFILWINQNRREMLKNAMEYKQKFNIVSDQTKKYFLDFDFTDNNITFIGNFAEVFKREVATTKIVDDLEDGFIHPEDVATINHNLKLVYGGETISDMKARLLNTEDKYVWCTITIIPISFDQSGNTTKALGFLEDVNDLVAETMYFKAKSEMDQLSQLYNRTTTESLIKEVVKKSSISLNNHCLYIIDIDNFKDLNDTFGHQFGDDVIKEISQYLKTIFRSVDIIGRLGGDEFFVFMRDVESKEQMEQRAALICETLDKTYAKDGIEIKVSASVGMACYPDHGVNFAQLYKYADLALYSTKEKGKNGYNFYNGETASNYKSNRTTIDSEIADSDEASTNVFMAN